MGALVVVVALEVLEVVAVVVVLVVVLEIVEVLLLLEGVGMFSSISSAGDDVAVVVPAPWGISLLCGCRGCSGCVRMVDPSGGGAP